MNTGDAKNVRLASDNEEPRQRATAIRDTSAQDIAIEPQNPRKRLMIIGGTIGAAILLVVLIFPLFNRWLQAEISVPRDRIRTAVVTRGDFVRDVGVQSNRR